MTEQVEKKELTWATVNLDDDEETGRFEEEELEKAGERIKDAVKELEERGIVDKKGQRRNKELPPDMRPGSETDV